MIEDGAITTFFKDYGGSSFAIILSSICGTAVLFYYVDNWFLLEVTLEVLGLRDEFKEFLNAIAAAGYNKKGSSLWPICLT